MEVSSRLRSTNTISTIETENDINLFRTNNDYSSDCSKVDGKRIKADTWYTLKEGKLVLVDDDDY